jgi:hypothetical protein
VGLDLVVADVVLGEGTGGGGSHWGYGGEADVSAAGESVSGVSRDGALSTIAVSDTIDLSVYDNERFLAWISTEKISRNVLLRAKRR